MKYSRLGREETGWGWTCLDLVGGKREVRVWPLVPFGSPRPVPGSLVRSPHVDMRYAHSIRAFGVPTLTALKLDLPVLSAELKAGLAVSSVFVVHSSRSLDMNVTS